MTDFRDDNHGIAHGDLLDASRQADGLTASIAKRQAKQDELEELRRKKSLTPMNHRQGGQR